MTQPRVLLFTLGLWGFTFFAFMAPGLAEPGGLAPTAAPLNGVAAALGLGLSLPLWLLMHLTRRWWLPLRMTVAGLIAAALAWTHAVLQMAAAAALLGSADAMPHTGGAATMAGVLESFLRYLWIYELYVTAVGLLISADVARERDCQLLASKASADEARLAALRFQLNPHFLFNTLNAISGFVVTRRAEQAEAMIERLSEFLRASLAAGRRETVTLADELATVDSYVAIERVRFGARLRYDLVCPDRLEAALIPSLILQPLIENAVKHAVSPCPAGATIRVAAWAEEPCLHLSVTDDGCGDRGICPGTASGASLATVRARLATMYGEDARLDACAIPGGFRAAIRLPLTIRPL